MSYPTTAVQHQRVPGMVQNLKKTNLNSILTPYLQHVLTLNSTKNTASQYLLHGAALVQVVASSLS